MDNLQLIAAQYGAKLINDTTAFTANVGMIKVISDTVFETLKVNGSTTDTKSDYIVGNASATIKAGTIIRAVNDGYFSEVKLVSGEVNVALYGQP